MLVLKANSSWPTRWLAWVIGMDFPKGDSGFASVLGKFEFESPSHETTRWVASVALLRATDVAQPEDVAFVVNPFRQTSFAFGTQ